MQKNDLFVYDGVIYRVLDIRGDEWLLIDCIKRTVPRWVRSAEFPTPDLITEDELWKRTGMIPVTMEALSPEEKKIVHERYTIIAGILPHIANEKKRESVLNR